MIKDFIRLWFNDMLKQKRQLFFLIVHLFSNMPLADHAEAGA